MICKLTKLTFLLLLLCCLSIQRAGAGEAISSHAKAVQTLPFTQTEVGFSGSLQILKDESATDQKAILRMINDRGQKMFEESLQEESAQIEKNYLYGTKSPTFFVTLDPPCEGGSYCGPYTYLYEIKEGKPVRVEVILDSQEDPAQIYFAQTLKSAWKISPLPQGKGVEILEIECHPNWPDHSMEFVIDYSTYRFDRGKWRRSQRQAQGFWENEGDWPDRSVFP